MQLARARLPRKPQLPNGRNFCATSVRDAGDGSYVVTYVVPYSGKHTLAVVLGNKTIKGSPFAIEVHPAP